MRSLFSKRNRLLAALGVFIIASIFMFYNNVLIPKKYGKIIRPTCVKTSDAAIGVGRWIKSTTCQGSFVSDLTVEKSQGE